MRALFRPVLAAALYAALGIPAVAQDPGVRPPDPTLPEVTRPAGERELLDIPVPTSLRQDAPQKPPERFRPLDELPPDEQFPAAPLLVGAYAFVLLALFAYLLSVAKRLGVVQREVDRLERDLKKSGRT